MNQPSPPERELAPNTSSAAISVRQANAQPILRPVRIDGNAAGTSRNITNDIPLRPQFCPAMRKVDDTEVKPEWVLSATAHSTECTITNTRLLAPSPNQSSASGSSAMAGSGLNMAVRGERRSVPGRVETASVVNTAAVSSPTP